MKKIKSYFYYVLITLVMFSCVPQNKIEYIYDSNNSTEQFLNRKDNIGFIKPDDVLLINVTSFDDISFNYFESQDNGRIMQAANELSLTALGYTVDDAGYIRFPIIGKISLGGLNVEEASLKLEKTLSPYFNQPNVSVKFAFRKITILGEVNNPGYHTYSNEGINIFEALGLAEGVNINGNLQKVLLLRTVEDKTNVYKIDLTKKETIESDLYFMQPNDVIVVNPRKSVKWPVVSVPLSTALSVISTTLLIINYLQ